jgi:hypothetical protein
MSIDGFVSNDFDETIGGKTFDGIMSEKLGELLGWPRSMR